MDSARIMLLMTAGILSVASTSTAENRTDIIQERDCPLKCVCTGNTIRCSEMSLFPEVLPKETVEFYISDSKVSVVPMNVFLNLPRLDRISMSRMTIGSIRACSFAELENVTVIEFNNVTLSVMEGNAFSNLVNISRISFEECAIKEIKSHSFHGARSMGSLTFLKTNISILQPYSVLQIDSIDTISFDHCFIQNFRYKGITSITNCSTFTIKESTIDNWQCGSLDPFMGNATDVSVTQSLFRCDCSLAWLWKKHPGMPIIAEDSNRCLVSSERMSTQTVDNVCPDVGSRDKGCRPLLHTTPHSCSKSFDDPILPEDKIDFPTYFSTPRNACGSMSCRVRLYAVLIYMNLLLKIRF